VQQRRFCLVAAGACTPPILLVHLCLLTTPPLLCTDHPLVSSISETADKLQ